ncbi:MAG: cytochrome c oxidase subunit 3 [Nitrospinae bacterium]|nr:cytochrome c oxidase subunit 3 [Nitrospinota bacterium]
MSDHAEHHGVHVPDHWETSPWPLTVSLGIFALCWAFMFQFVYSAGMAAVIALAIGTILVAMSVIGWVGETVGKADFGFSPVAMLLYILTEAMIFLAFFVAYWRMKLQAGAAAWPPEGTPEITAGMQFVALGLLFIGSFAAHKADAKYKTEPESTGGLLLVPVIVGAVFLVLVYSELAGMAAQGFTIGTNAFGTTVFGLGGWHAAHILVGMVMYLLIALSTMKGNTSRSYSSSAAIYWDFCTVVHFFVVMQVYVWK